MGPRPWLTNLKPRDQQSFRESCLLRARADDMAALLGPGPAGWAVELGATMADRIASAIPELAVDAVATEVRKGCEAAALGALATLAGDTQVMYAAVPEMLTGPTEVVARGIGIEHMLRSIHIAHAAASEVLLDAAVRVIPAHERFAEIQQISELLFDAVDVITTRMAREYARAHEAWMTSSVALRMKTVEDILAGTEIPLGRAAHVLGYDLSRWHLAVIAWTAGGTQAGPQDLHDVAVGTLAAAGCVSTLVLPIGAQRLWAWGSRTAHPPIPTGASARPRPDVWISTGLGGVGVEGFRRSHQQASHAARVGEMSTSGGWLFRYEDLDLVAMLSADLPAALEFVTRELGALIGPGDGIAMMRHTLKCYLDRDRSLARTADHLLIARNTVAYRVRRAEQLRGRAVSERRLQLHAALALADILGDAALSPLP